MEVVVLLSVLLCVVTGHVVSPSCDKADTSCEFSFTVTNIMSMMMADEDGWTRPVVFNNGSVYRRPTCNYLQELTQSEVSSLVTVDGIYRPLLAINNQIPGPPIVIYQGQEVIVHVENLMVNEATSLHFHGVTQRGSPWMDGADGITQCPVTPEKTFTYRFTPDTVGTHWYHAHSGSQRSSGLFGPFVVLPDLEAEEVRGPDNLLEFTEDFYIFIQDFYHKSSWEIYYQDLYFLGPYSVSGYDKKSDDCGRRPQIDSILINGKGWYYPPGSSTPENTGVPLETFTVEEGGRYRFRLIQPSLAAIFIISIDKHKLNVIATDLSDVTMTTVDYLIVTAGERYDFYIDAEDVDGTGLYWIRVETPRCLDASLVSCSVDEEENRHGEAVLLYGNKHRDKKIPNLLPSSQPKPCSALQPCKVLNCPFRDYPIGTGRICMNLDDMEKAVPTPTLQPSDNGGFSEHFLSLNTLYSPPARAINGKIFTSPRLPPVLYPFVDRLSCNECVDSKVCACTHTIQVRLGDVVQLVVSGGTGHPVHLHGHVFQLIKIAYPGDEQSFGNTHPHLTCLDTNCYNLTWSDPSWRGGSVPGIKQVGAVEKDTVFVPQGGYVILRFKADNPGFWLLHCHMEYHNLAGMRLIIQAGDDGQMLTPPPQLAGCAPPGVKYRTTPALQVQADDVHGYQGTSYQNHLIIFIGAIIISTIVLLIIFGVLIKKYNNRWRGYNRIPEQ